MKMPEYIPGTGNEIKKIASWDCGSFYHSVTRFKRGHGAWYDDRFVLARVETWYEYHAMMRCGFCHVKRITANEAKQLIEAHANGSKL